MRRNYSLRKARHIFRLGLAKLRRRRKKLDAARFEAELLELERAIKAKDRERASELAKKLEASPLFYRSPLRVVIDVVIGIAIALAIATVVRQMWFEPMEIPSGSMRPTFQELDKLIVVKDTFSLNVPMKPAHFIFRPNNVERTGVFIFTSEDMDIADQDTMYFYVLPAKRRLIKRCMGKPGDTVYFYGGEVLGFDKDGKDFEMGPWMKGLDYVPFLTFMGKATASRGNYIIRQMNIPIAKVGMFKGKMLVDASYSELWGIGNFAMAKLEGNTLVLSHSPSVTKTDRGMPILKVSRIELDKSQLAVLASNIYTCRFLVRNGHAFPEIAKKQAASSIHRVAMEEVPDGRYQFQDGVAQEVLFSGILKDLSKDHPLYKVPVETLFNYGMSMISRARVPARYAYYRDGDLYVMGRVLLEKDDPTLVAFVEKGEFVDSGRPSRETIEQFGLKIPEGHYLALGDNHAGSGDSRVFGFVPAENLRGTPSFIFWPPGPRWGPPAQKPYPWITLPRVIVWSIAILIALLVIWWRRRLRSQLDHL